MWEKNISKNVINKTRSKCEFFKRTDCTMSWVNSKHKQNMCMNASDVAGKNLIIKQYVVLFKIFYRFQISKTLLKKIENDNPILSFKSQLFPFIVAVSQDHVLDFHSLGSCYLSTKNSNEANFAAFFVCLRSMVGFDAKNRSSISSSFICRTCNLIFRDPCQLACGHRQCKTCIDSIEG